MPGKSRYIVTIPTAVPQEAALGLPDIVAPLPEDRIVRQGQSGLHVVELTGEEAAELAYEGLVIEDDQELQLLLPMPGIGFRVEDAAGRNYSFQVVNETDKKPIDGVTIFIIGSGATYQATTGKDGKATVRVFERSVDGVIVSPAANFWSRVIALPGGSATITVQLTPLIPPGAGAWGREAVGLAEDFPFTGAGVKVAILDSGIAKHPDLAVAGGFNALDGEDSADFRRDENGHGTYCAGIIAGRNAKNGVLGVVPDADIYSVKVFPGGRLSDLLEGIQWCMENNMDVISISLGVPYPSQILAAKLAEVAAAGITLVAAAGNDGGPLIFPAANDAVMAVSAFGSTKAFPEDSAHGLRVSDLHNEECGLFVANFCNTGAQMAYIGPGVAVVSSVPTGHAAWDGTSAACSFIAGLAALVLCAYPEIKTGDARQWRAIHEILRASALNLSLPDAIQGAGIPQANRALTTPLLRREAIRQFALVRQEHQDRLGPLIAEIEQKQQDIRDLLAKAG